MCALLSAFFAALTTILAKTDIKGINTDLATAILLLVVSLGNVLIWKSALGTTMIVGGTLIL